MTVLYSNDFESETAWAGLAAWPTTAGSGMGVRAELAVRGTKSFGNGSNGDMALWTGSAGLGNQCIRHAQLFQSGIFMGAVLRGNVANQGYWCGLSNSGGTLSCTLSVYDFGTVSSVNAPIAATVSAGQVVHFEAKAIGSAIEVRAWIGSDARPTSAIVSITDTRFSTGSVGVRRWGSFGYGTCDDL
ncbi:MAG: hypothetical protein RL375_2401, partial [Pseudomonadota bacterium]